jgi:hypothetical protein
MGQSRRAGAKVHRDTALRVFSQFRSFAPDRNQEVLHTGAAGLEHRSYHYSFRRRAIRIDYHAWVSSLPQHGFQRKGHRL